MTEEKAVAPRAARVVAPPAGGGNLKKYLMLGIIVLTVVLGAAVAWRLYSRSKQGARTVVNVGADFSDAMQKAIAAQREIFKTQSSVWNTGEPLSPAQLDTIRTGLETLRESHDRVADLLDLLRAQRKLDSKEGHTMAPRWIQLKLWILDAEDLLDSDLTTPKYGGLYIPMYLAIESVRRGQKELDELQKEKAALLQGDAAAKEEAANRLKRIEDALAEAASTFSALDEYVKEGLARPDLTPEQLDELRSLRDEASNATMMRKVARGLRAEFQP